MRAQKQRQGALMSFCPQPRSHLKMTNSRVQWPRALHKKTGYSAFQRQFRVSRALSLLFFSGIKVPRRPAPLANHPLSLSVGGNVISQLYEVAGSLGQGPALETRSTDQPFITVLPLGLWFIKERKGAWMHFPRGGQRPRTPAKVEREHEIKRRLLLERKVMANLDSISKSRNITLPTKVQIVKAIVYPVVM